MAESESSSSTSAVDEVILEIEGTQLTCNKKELALHSDYFKAMFEGDFVERNQKVVKIEGVQLKGLNKILTFLSDERYIIDQDNVFLIVQTACMLQFVKIQTICIDKMIEMLSPKYCLNIWFTCATYDIQPLGLKAKSLALMEFHLVKDTPFLLELNLYQLYIYLANVNLKCDNEMHVFQTAMKWFYENSEHYSEKMSETLLTLLHCVSFQGILCSDIREMLTYPDICGNTEITSILNCVIDLKNKAVLNYSEDVISKATILLGSKRRKYRQLPCFLVDQLFLKNEKPASRKKSRFVQEFTVVYYGKLYIYFSYKCVGNHLGAKSHIQCRM